MIKYDNRSFQNSEPTLKMAQVKMPVFTAHVKTSADKITCDTNKNFRRFSFPAVSTGQPRKFTCSPSGKLSAHLFKTLLCCSQIY